MELKVQFKNPQQEEFFFSTARCQCFSGGFNNGKTYVGCLKALTLLLTFSNYRMIIARQTYTDLKRTTMETFLKMCPSELIVSHNTQDGLTVLSNGSQIYWLHLDNVDESTLRGIEPNSILVDQAEEISEKVYDVLDGRVGRWDGALLPLELKMSVPIDWPTKNNLPIIPSYLMLLCNPDTEFHFIYRKYHIESQERVAGYFFVNGEWDRNLGSEESYDSAILRDEEWVNKYVKGLWGSSDASIHHVRPDSLLDYTPELVEHIKAKGNLFRILDHGDSAPTCCLWATAIDGVYIFYREYYASGRVISYHRKAIAELSENEQYSNNWADPQIFKKTAQKQGGFWSVADEYRDSDLEGPELIWQPADNAEFSTRNRINELLLPRASFKHPITKKSPAPGLYLVRTCSEYPYGCKESIKQLGAQRKKLLGTYEGKSLYSDDRDEDIVDHAYDCIRYFVAQHGSAPRTVQKKPGRMTMGYYQAILKRKEWLSRAVVQ